MPTSCCIKGCTNRHTKGCNLGFFRLPTETPRRNTWLSIIGDKVTNPSDSSRICGTHFSSGRPSQDPDNIDFIPTIFTSISSSGSSSSSISSADAQRGQVRAEALQSNHLEHAHREQRQTRYQENSRHHSASHSHQSWRISLKRTGSCDDISDSQLFYNIPPKYNRLSTHEENSNGHEDNGCSNGVSREPRLSPRPTFADSTTTKSRLFFPKAILGSNNRLSVKAEDRQHEYTNTPNRVSPPADNNRSHYATPTSIRDQYDRARQRTPTSVSSYDDRSTQQDFAGENCMLRKRIRYLDSVVSELKAQLTEQKHYIERLQDLTRRSFCESPNVHAMSSHQENGVNFNMHVRDNAII